jgi:RNA polymerase sigma factor (TIGR02999 family)
MSLYFVENQSTKKVPCTRMIDSPQDNLVDLLAAVESGEPDAFDHLIAAVYPELKKLAHFHLVGERPGHTLNTTAIVHEAYVRLSGSKGNWVDRRHFLRASSKVMRHLLVDHARKRNTDKRGGGAKVLTLEENRLISADDSLAVLALDDAIKEMREIDPRLEEIVECRFFTGLSVSETAEALGISTRTVERGWQRARAYLLSALDIGDE